MLFSLNLFSLHNNNMARLFVLLCIVLFSVYKSEQISINKFNELASKWKAGVNFDPSAHFVDLIKLQGSSNRPIHPDFTYKRDDEAYDKLPNPIPKTFDAREAWKHCGTIGKVRDQGICGADWAFSTSSAFADRLCIATGGKFNEQLSAEGLAFCCTNCGYGCNGGYPIKAWDHFKDYGLYTGGDYGSNKGCQPYRFPPCPLDKYGNSKCKGDQKGRHHLCIRRCYGDTNIDRQKDKRYTNDSYYLTYGSIQKDVMAYGPIAASFQVYEDFLSYKSGVYEHSKDAAFVGVHSAKLIGWGEENGVPYWLLVNSWNEHWGDKGLFKIRRGTNECEIDNYACGGVPLVK